ncbi:hypothetical protein [Saccharicrinis aurantiacus]|uniref:hypothetical protein n=1 Tax=Saccharicrinis aurantiacus TaxID=1849719 RepID=UPI001FE3F59F|nr:hypothetical protein [Saccharicrinis aurantiacus]
MAVTSVTKADEIELKGTFQGDNLFVKNPFAQSGVGFCVYEVTVNGLTTTDEINSSAFEVDLSVYGFKIGEPLIIAIKYKEDCKPMVLNAETLKPRSTFEIVSLSVDEDNIKWKTKKEAGSLDFNVQQFRWNKWVNVGTVTGKGTPDGGTYSAKVRLHSGQNRFRLKQTDHRGKPRYSKETSITSSKQAVTFSPSRVDDIITFSDETMYEIYDVYGGIMFKGYGKEIKVNGLAKGKYYLNMDNKLTTFNKK